MLESIFKVFICFCAISAYAFIVVWHVKEYIGKYGEIIWPQVVLSVFFWLPIFGYVLYFIYTKACGKKPDSYIDF
jgi:hypothetical protein